MDGCGSKRGDCVDLLDVCVAARCVPAVDVLNFPWSQDLTIELVESGDIGRAYLSCLAEQMLEWQRAICDIPGVEFDFPSVRMLLVAQRVHARVSMAMRVMEKSDMSGVEKLNMYHDAVAYLEQIRGWQSEFIFSYEREQLIAVVADRHVYDMFDVGDKSLGACRVAAACAVGAFHTVTTLVEELGEMADGVSAVELPHVVVIGTGNSTLSQVRDKVVGNDKPVVPIEVYRFVLAGGVSKSAAGVYQVRYRAFDGGGDEVVHVTSVACRVRVDLVGLNVALGVLVAVYMHCFETPVVVATYGYCYLKCFPLLSREFVCDMLGKSPTVGSCRELASELGMTAWSSDEACVEQVGIDIEEGVGIYHVRVDGVIPAGLDSCDVLAGDRPPRDIVVYNALCSVFDDIGVVPLSVVTADVGRQSVGSSGLGGVSVTEVDSPDMSDADMDALADKFFSELGVVCQRKPARSVTFARLDSVAGVASAEWIGRDEQLKDTERARKLEERMQSGPVVSDAYCKSVSKRHDEGRSRPKEGTSRGRALQFGDMYAPQVVERTTAWLKDKDVAIPGWTTYTFKVPAGEHEFVLTSPLLAECDCRLDWSGDRSSVIVAKSVQTPCDGTVMWFVRALPVRVKGSKSCVVRCSVPLAGSAYALGWPVRRFYMMHQVLGMRVFDTVRPPTYVDVALKSRWHGTAGVSTCRARSAFDVTALSVGVSFTLSGLVVLGTSESELEKMPAMVGIRAASVGSLSRVYLGGVTLTPDSQGKVTVVTCDWKTGFSLSVSAFTIVQFSVVFIVDPYAFEVRYAKHDMPTPTSG